MKKIFALMTICLWAGTSSALLDDGISSLGFYFDNTGDVNCFAPAPFVPFQLYAILANPEVANMGGFEFAWRFTPAPASAPIIQNFVLPPQALNIGDNDNVIVGLGNGLITSEATVLVRIDMILLAAMDPETFIQVGPATPASHPGHAAYNNFEDPAQIIDMNFSTVDGVDVIVDEFGWVVPGVAIMNCTGGVVATEAATWGNVKTLFR